MADKIRYNDLVEGDWFKDAITSAVVLIDKLEEVKKSVIEIGNATKANIKGNKLQTPEDLGAYTADTAKVKELTKSIEEQQAQINKLNKEIEKLIKVKNDNKKSTEEDIRAREKERQIQNDLVAGIRAEIKEQQAQKGSISALRAEMATMNRERERLNLGNEESKKRFIQLTESINKTELELKAFDAQIGRHQRNVGNYNMQFTAFNQTLREAPAFANSVQTGLMGISNNLPMFADEIKRARTEGQSWGSILKSLGSSIFGFGGIVTIAVTALTFLPKILKNITGESKTTADGIDILSKSLQDGRKYTDELGKSLEELILKRQIGNKQADEADLKRLEAQKRFKETYNKIEETNNKRVQELTKEQDEWKKKQAWSVGANTVQQTNEFNSLKERKLKEINSKLTVIQAQYDEDTKRNQRIRDEELKLIDEEAGRRKAKEKEKEKTQLEILYDRLSKLQQKRENDFTLIKNGYKIHDAQLAKRNAEIKATEKLIETVEILLGIRQKEALDINKPFQQMQELERLQFENRKRTIFEINAFEKKQIQDKIDFIKNHPDSDKNKFNEQLLQIEELEAKKTKLTNDNLENEFSSNAKILASNEKLAESELQIKADTQDKKDAIVQKGKEFEITQLYDLYNEQVRLYGESSEQALIAYNNFQIAINKLIADEEEKKRKKQKEANDNLVKQLFDASEFLMQQFVNQQKLKIQALDAQFEASKNHEQTLRALAQSRTEGSLQNLAFEQKRQAEIQKEKMKMLKEQLQYEQAIAALKLVESAVTKGSGSKNSFSLFGDSNLTNLLSPKAFETGGLVTGGEQFIRINEKGEEFVANATATQKYKPVLEDINNMRFNPEKYAMQLNYEKDNSIQLAMVNELTEIKDTIKNQPQLNDVVIDKLRESIIYEMKKGNNTFITHKPLRLS